MTVALRRGIWVGGAACVLLAALIFLRGPQANAPLTGSTEIGASCTTCDARHQRLARPPAQQPQETQP